MLTRKTRANQTINYSYDTLNRLVTKTPPSPAPVVSYRYDINGRLISASDSSAAIATPPTGTSFATNISYDALNRPTAVTWSPAPASATPSISVAFTHSYNKANQRSGQSVSDNSWLNVPAATPSTVNYSANALNQYTAVGAVSPSYDGNGNLTNDGTFTFGYDAENRLTSASGAGNTVSYTYDAQGRRKTRTVNGTTTVFVATADNREVMEYDGAGGAIQRWYAYGAGSNNVLSQMNVAAGTRASFIPDMLGSVIASIDAGSGAVSKIGYLPYGKSGTTPPFGFTGQRVDPEIGGLYYYRARHYSPAWGRFLQPDPLGTITDNLQPGNNGTGNRANLYAYVGNDPLNNVDPFGLWTLQIGFSVNIQFGLLTLQGSSGLAIDNHGNIAILNVAGFGGGAGGRFSGGVSVASSNADTVGQLGSWFSNASVGVAAGPSASVDAFHGIDEASGKTIVGGGFTAGIGLGGGGSATQTYTAVTPLNYSSPDPTPTPQFAPTVQAPISK